MTTRQIRHSFLAIGCTIALAWSKEPVRPRITGVPHLAVYAKDMAASRTFYREFLGYEEPFQVPDKKTVYFKINDRQYLKLLPEIEPNSDRLSHISLETNDIEGMRAYLASRGVSVPAKAEKNEVGNLSFRFKDPEGHTVEFLQFQSGSLTSKTKGKSTPAGRVSQRMMHVGIIVTKLDPQMKFYTEVLGFKEFWRGSSNGTQLSWINMKVPDGEDYIELMLYKDPPAPTARGSAHHQCLEVPDIQAALATVEAKPYRKSYARPLEIRTGRNRKRQLNLFDPDGTRTELMEPGTVDGVPAPSSTAPPPS